MGTKKLDLREVENTNCAKDCSPDDRKKITEDGICNLTSSELDNLTVRCVGRWAYDKIYYLTKYFAIFSIGMKKKWKTNYIEICCGPGRCVRREDGIEFDGTPLAIINHDAFEFIENATFIDKNPKVIHDLNDRISVLGKSKVAQAKEGDYNDKTRIRSILQQLPKRCLNLVFVDPSDCSAPFSVIEIIKDELENVDLIINVAFGTDVKRNIKIAVMEPNSGVRQKYSTFLGGNDYFNKAEVIKYAEEDNHGKLTELFVREFKEKLRGLGFVFFDAVQIKHYYHLLFATKNKTGYKFWQQAKKISPKGQYTFLNLN